MTETYKTVKESGGRWTFSCGRLIEVEIEEAAEVVVDESLVAGVGVVSDDVVVGEDAGNVDGGWEEGTVGHSDILDKLELCIYFSFSASFNELRL